MMGTSIGSIVYGLAGEVPRDIVVASISGRLVRPDLAEQVLAQVDALAFAAAAAVGQFTGEAFTVDNNGGHTTTEGVLVVSGRVVCVRPEHT